MSTVEAQQPASTQLSVAKKRRTDLVNYLNNGRTELEKCLPKQIPVDYFYRALATSLSKTPRLLECRKETVWLALLNAAQSQLPPDGYHGHLVPYGDTCQFIPDYKGLIQLALRCDVVVDAYAVYTNDLFEYQLGTEARIKHVPSETDRGGLRAAYAVASFANGTKKFVVATCEDILKRKESSKANTKSDSPWVQWPEMMWIKTAVKMLSKYLPRNRELQAALEADDMAEMGIQQLGSSLPESSLIAESQQQMSRTEELASRMGEDDNSQGEG